MSAFQFAKGETWIIDGTLHDQFGNALPTAGTAVTFYFRGPFPIELSNESDSISWTNEGLGAIQIVVKPEDQPEDLIEGVYEFEVWAELSTGTLTQQEWGTISVLESAA